MGNKKTAVFPVDYQTVTLVKYAHLCGYKIIALVPPDLNVLAGRNVSVLNESARVDIKLHANYHQKIAESDLVCFLDNESTSDDSLCQDLIDYAKSIDKEVIVADRLLRRLNSLERPLDQLIDLRLFPLNIPIISVFSMGEKCGQPETELSIRQHFLSQGYKVLHIGSQEYCHLFGSLPLPDFLYEHTIGVQEKIIRFNQFVYQACRAEDWDVIVLGVPDPIMKYNNDILNGLGVLPFIIQNAVKSDVGVLNMHYNDYNYEFLKYVSQYCKYRLDIEIKYFGISNTTSYKNAEGQNELDYLQVNSSFVNANLAPGIGKNKYTVFSIFDDGERTHAFQKIEQELATNLDQV